jgi:probable HAF family extracellular repeat protein
MPGRISRALLGAGALTFISTANALPMYEIVSLGFLDPGFASSGAAGLNNLGQVVGGSTNASGLTEAFVWDAVNGMQGLGFLSQSTNSSAAAINDAGIAVGRSRTDADHDSDGEAEHFMWDPVNGIQSLGRSHPDGTFGSADDINEASQVAGTSVYADQFGGTSSFASTWNATDGHVNLGYLDGNPDHPGGNAYAINESGVIVGEAFLDIDVTGAFIWTEANGMTALNPLDPGGLYTTAFDINDDNDVVGRSRDSNGRDQAVLWAGGLPDPVLLEFLAPSDTYAAPAAINNSDIVVGSIINSTIFPFFGPLTLAVAWENLVPTYLANLLVDPQDWAALLGATDINDQGQIVGTGVKFRADGSFYVEAFLMTPVRDDVSVPEPATLALLLLGIPMLERSRIRTLRRC